MSECKVMICIPQLCTGGTEMVTLQLLRLLRSSGCAVQICVYYGHDAAMVTAAVDNGAEMMLLEREPGGSGELLQLTRALRARMRAWRPDIVHVQYLTPGLPPLLAARLARVPAVLATVHHERGDLPWQTVAMMRTARWLTDHMVAVSEAAAASWFGAASAPGLSVIYNGLDTTAIAGATAAANRTALRREFDINADGMVCAVVARLHHVKGHAFLWSALRRMQDAGQPLPTILAIGAGPHEDEIRASAAAAGIASAVRWAGVCDRTRTLALLGAADALVVPSAAEGLGLAAIEGMAAGLPIVASAVGGLPEVLAAGRCGLLAPYGDAAALAEHLGRLMTSPELRAELGAAGRQRASEVFGLAPFSTAYATLYESLAPTEPAA
jgi:glycosyltransferase involved in cell wall biosynthesis